MEHEVATSLSVAGLVEVERTTGGCGGEGVIDQLFGVFDGVANEAGDEIHIVFGAGESGCCGEVGVGAATDIVLVEFANGDDIEVHCGEVTVDGESVIVFETNGGSVGEDNEADGVGGLLNRVLNGGFYAGIVFLLGDIFGGADVDDDNVFFGNFSFGSVVCTDLPACF